MQYLIITGNPVDGLEFYGPFDSAEEANEYADNNIDLDWWVGGLNKPEEE